MATLVIVRPHEKNVRVESGNPWHSLLYSFSTTLLLCHQISLSGSTYKVPPSTRRSTRWVPESKEGCTKTWWETRKTTDVSFQDRLVYRSSLVLESYPYKYKNSTSGSLDPYVRRWVYGSPLWIGVLMSIDNPLDLTHHIGSWILLLLLPDKPSFDQQRW